MRKEIFFILCSVFLIAAALNVSAAIQSAAVEACYTFDSVATDSSPNARNLITIGTVPYSTTLKKLGSGSAGPFTDANFFNITYGTWTHNMRARSGGTVSLWINITSIGAWQGVYSNRHDVSTPNGIVQTGFRDDTDKIWLAHYTSTWEDLNGQTISTLNQWHHVVYVFHTNGTVVQHYNGVATAYDDVASISTITNWFTIGRAQNIGPWLGKIDEFTVWNTSLSQSEINSLYNSGSGQTCSEILGSGSPQYYLTLNATDITNNTQLIGMCANFTGSSTFSLCNTTSYIITNTTGLYNITLWNISGNTYYPQTIYNYNFSTTTSTQFNVTQNIANISISRLFYNTSISSFNVSYGRVSNTTTSGRLLLPVPSGISSITVNVSGNYSLTASCNITGYQNTSSCFLGSIVHDSYLNLSLFNRWSGLAVQNYSGFIIHIPTGTNVSYSTTNGSTYIPSILGDNVTAYLFANRYSSTLENNRTFNINSTLMNYSFYLYSNNSIISYVYYQANGTLIMVPVTILGQSTSYVFQNETVNGSSIVENLPDGVYTLAYSASGLETSQYYVTVTDRSTQVVNAYLITNTSSVIFTVQDSASGSNIYGAVMSQYRLVNNTLTLVSSRTTDINGNTIFDYVPDVRYTFMATSTGYNPTTFTLNPILFSSYNVQLTRNISSQPNADYTGVLITYSPREYFVNRTANFSILFYSQNGTLSQYNMSLYYPGGSYTGSGVNSNGQRFNNTFTIASASYVDSVNISYCYTNVWGSMRCFDYYYGINGVYGNTTLISMKDADLPLLDRVVLGLGMTGLIAGLSAVLFGGTIGSVVLLAMFIVVTTIGLIPFWLCAVSIVIGAIIFIRSGSK